MSEERTSAHEDHNEVAGLRYTHSSVIQTSNSYIIGCAHHTHTFVRHNGRPGLHTHTDLQALISGGVVKDSALDLRKSPIVGTQGTVLGKTVCCIVSRGGR